MAQILSLGFRGALFLATAPLVVYSADQAPLAGAANFRDIGAYQTTGGHKIKSHVIFRSGELSGLTASDQKVLGALRIRYEYDLRTDKEREQAPSRWGTNSPKVFAISVGEPRNADPSQTIANRVGELTDATKARQFMQETTARLAINGAPQIGEVMRRLAEGDEPALIHCTAGKDRTGVTVAILMTLLQVPKDDVYREYMKSNDAIDQQFARAKARDTSGLLALPPAALRELMGTEQSYMEAVFHAIDAQYGSFDAYARNGLKIGAEQIQALRTRLLER
jgi:protein-tyrosine phosphatase